MVPKNTMGVASRLVDGLEALIFPPMCTCCGDHYVGKDRTICGYCLDNRFEPGNPLFDTSILDHILPEGIEWVHALWRFDKGGSLQDLIHKLKYQHQQRIGIDLGRYLGANLLQHPLFNSEEREAYLLLPVPLHKRKLRKRGYNQARAIAEGVSESTGIRVMEPGTVIRVRPTVSQTGLTRTRRQKNIENAFQVNGDKKSIFQGRKVIVIDDVITTGATAFEVGRLIMGYGSSSVAILTVGRP